MNFIRSGFRTVRENPALAFAEIAWRWAFGAAAWILVILTIRAILQGIDVSSAEIALARTNNAYLIADAVVRILVQVLPRFARALLILIPGLSVVWLFAATFGREATVNALLARSGKAIHNRFWPAGGSSSFFRVLSLNAIRAIFTLATVLAFFGTVLLVSAQMPSRTQPDVAPLLVLAWLVLAFLVGCFWGLVNWFLALAPIFIVRNGLGVGKAISASLGLYRDARRDYMSIASWFGFFRGAALLVATVAGLTAVAANPRAGLIASVVIALFYFAIADWLYIARLAAYIGLAESPAPDVKPLSSPETLGPSPLIPETPPETETETETQF